jgi:hypothetical protein
LVFGGSVFGGDVGGGSIIGVFGITSLFFFINAFFWETLKPYYQKMSGQ